MDTVGEVRDMLAQAEFFLRAADPNGAAARGRQALRLATDALGPDAEITQEAALELERFDTAARAWREEAAAREQLRDLHQADSNSFWNV